MKKAEESFISSTFWTERVGFVAANRTLEIFDSTLNPMIEMFFK